MRDLSELTTKMKANLKTVGAAAGIERGRYRRGFGVPGAILSVGAAEHLIVRGLVEKVDTTHGLGRAKGLYRLTAAGVRALDKF